MLISLCTQEYKNKNLIRPNNEVSYLEFYTYLPVNTCIMNHFIKKVIACFQLWPDWKSWLRRSRFKIHNICPKNGNWLLATSPKMFNWLEDLHDYRFMMVLKTYRKLWFLDHFDNLPEKTNYPGFPSVDQNCKTISNPVFIKI